MAYMWQVQPSSRKARAAAATSHFHPTAMTTPQCCAFSSANHAIVSFTKTTPLERYPYIISRALGAFYQNGCVF